MSIPRTQLGRIELADDDVNLVSEESSVVREELEVHKVLENARSIMRQRAERKPKPSDSGPIRLS
ncbi:MAG: hypothetical protein K8U57_33455 [Planctomycetes bacterium]|nr:hypothetical protein [Planctomycetota bacterium]